MKEITWYDVAKREIERHFPDELLKGDNMKTATNKLERMYQDIQRHGEQLNAIFNTGFEPIELCKKLRRLEMKAHQLATDYCNGENGVNTDNWDAKCEPILKAVHKILNISEVCSGIFVNGDARGYALKIDSETVTENALDIYTDWGGFGIIAPDFTV